MQAAGKQKDAIDAGSDREIEQANGVELADEAVGPVGETDVVSVMVPLKPLILVKVTVEDAHDPPGVVRLEGLVVMEKSGEGTLLLKVAVWTVSGTGIGVPFATVTHTPPLTLVLVQPVWNPRVIPGVAPVTL